MDRDALKVIYYPTSFITHTSRKNNIRRVIIKLSLSFISNLTKGKFSITNAESHVNPFPFFFSCCIQLALIMQPVSYILYNALPWTLFLVITSITISFFIGNRMGRYAGTILYQMSTAIS